MPTTLIPARTRARTGARLLAVLLAILLTVPALGVGSAVAADDRAERNMADKKKHKKNGSWVIRGTATPEAGEKPIIVKRKKCKSCDWKRHGKVRTKKTGRYNIKLTFPKSSKPTWYWKGVLKGGKKYKTARTRVYLTCSRKDC